MNTITETISPELAALYLRSNTNNRHVRKTHVKWLANAMKAGEWQLTHQGICFDTNGVLVDGQHRLLAIIEAATPVRMLVTRGVAPENFMACDLGVVRSAADVTRMDKKRAEVLNLLSCLSRHCKLSGRHMPSHILLCDEKFGAATDRLLEFAGTMKKSTTKATIRAAAVLCIAEGNEFALQQYRCASLLEFSGMSPAVQSLVRQMLGTCSKGSDMQREQEFCRALHAFNPDNSDISRLQIKDISRHLHAAQQRINNVLAA